MTRSRRWTFSPGILVPLFVALLLFGGADYLAAAPGGALGPAAPAADREALLEQTFLEIRDLSFTWGDVGSVLEAIAFVEFRKRYPEPAYAVIPGVVYFNGEGRTLGELDLIVFDPESERVLEVYEVKLTASPRNAADRADRQLERLRRALEQGAVDEFRSPEGFPTLLPRHFDAGTFYGKIGSRETRGADWTHSFDLSRPEGDILQAKILAYRRQ